MQIETEIFLFRHGKTLANEKRLYCGKTDVELSEAGRAELKKKRDSYIYPKLHQCKIFTSGMKRVSQSLGILYPEFSNVAEVEKKFSEINFGDFEMKSYEELRTNDSYQKWVQNLVDRITNFPCPNGESFSQMKLRVLFALKKIVSDYPSVAIFTHGGVISVIMEKFFPNERKSFYDWQPDFGEGYKISLKNYSTEKAGSIEKSEFEIAYEKIPYERENLTAERKN